MSTLLEISSHDGLGKLSKVKKGEQILFFPRLVKLVHLTGNSSLFRRIHRSSDIHTKMDDLAIIFHPSMQLLDTQAVNSRSFMPPRWEESSDSGIYFHVLPSDELISLNSDLSDYFDFLDSYLEETGLESTECGLRVPQLSQELLIQLVDFFKQKKFILASLSNTIQLLTNPARMSKYITAIVSSFPSKLLFHAPAVDPSWFPLLTYAGMDIFDTLGIEKLTEQTLYMTPAGHFPLKGIMEGGNFPCTCPACDKISNFDLETQNSRDLLLDHNITQAEQSIRLIRQIMGTNSLRDMVKSSFTNIPPAAALLRKLDTQYGHLLEERLTVNKNLPLPCSYESDLSRPEIQRFVQRAKEFIPSSLTKICLILPCSRRKPYSLSKSHQLFHSTVKKAISNKFRSILSEVIVTSPLGAVPRELEGIYPAAHYDIPVTGDWSTDEIARSVDCLKSYLSKLPPDVKIIAHVSGSEANICQEVLADRDPVFTSKNKSVTSGESLGNLNYELRKVIKENKIESIPKGHQVRKVHSLRAIADYQFGSRAGNHFVHEDDNIRESRAGITITAPDRARVAILSRENGYFSIGVEGATRLAAGKYHLIVFGGEKFEGNAIYCPGIVSADHCIRPGDDVMIMDESGVNLLGTGRAIHHGKFLEESDYGLGVSIRKKVVK